uniref:Uncharacterized protein n=1 Tax=Anguilla anguilla TaxID=7936 RepID=A0A0E9SIK1_ANGAN
MLCEIHYIYLAHAFIQSNIKISTTICSTKTNLKGQFTQKLNKVRFH